MVPPPESNGRVCLGVLHWDCVDGLSVGHILFASFVGHPQAQL